MRFPAGFGVNVVCYRGDYPFAKACCASIREHLGDIDIDLYVDGDLDVVELVRLFGVRPVYRRDVQSAVLRERSFGYGLTKMIVFWESRFERFLYLDADTILWGNPLHGVDLEAADLIHNTPHEAYTPEIVKTQYFDYDRLFAHTRPFPWRDCHLFNSGVLVARRGVFPLDEYLHLLTLKGREPDLLPTGEQGIINVLAFRGAAEGRLTLAEAPLQVVIPVVDRRELERRYRIVAGRPEITPDAGTVLHWAGPKPFVLQRGVFAAPMTYYRRRLRRRAGGLSRLTPLVVEDLRADPRRAMPSGMRAALRHALGRLRRLN